jgi:hypothetical protein
VWQNVRARSEQDIQSGDLVLITLATRNLPVQNFSLAFTPMVIATGGEQLKKL